MVELECTVDKREALRMPGVYRLYALCEDISLGMELLEEVYNIPSGSRIVVYIGKEKDKCLEMDFCGHGYIVSSTKMDDHYRTIISIGGLLLILKHPVKHEIKDLFKLIEKYYVGIKRV